MNEIFKPKNVAAWQIKEKSRPLVVSKADYTSPPKDHVTIKVVDVAVNPIDWILQGGEGWDLDYPAILGRDAAGEILEVGEDVKDFRVGQRVIAYVHAGSREVCCEKGRGANVCIGMLDKALQLSGAFRNTCLYTSML